MTSDESRNAFHSSTRDVWLLGTLHETSGELRLNLEDERGARCDVDDGAEPGEPDAQRIPLELFQSGTVRVAPTFSQFVAAAAQRQAARSAGGAPGAPDPVPLFLTGLSERSSVLWNATPWHPALGPIQVVIAARRGTSSLPPCALPLRVLASIDAEHALSELVATSWHADDAIVRDFGLRIEVVPPPYVYYPMPQRPWDVVVVGSSDASYTLSDAPRATRRYGWHTDLVIIVGADPSKLLHHDHEEWSTLLAPGTALLVVAEHEQTPGFLRAFFFGIFHDKPLHAALHEAQQHVREVSAWLVADPVTNQALRISDALSDVRERGDALRYGASAGDVPRFLARAHQDTPVWQRIEAALQRASPYAPEVAAVIRQAEQFSADFSRETRGLVPMAYTLSQLAQAGSAARAMRDELAALARDAEAVSELERVQQRYVDVGLEQRDGSSTGFIGVQKQYPLLERSEYRLRISVGHRMDDGLIEGDPPPLDPLLPELEAGACGHELEVVVFEKDFELLSGRVVPLTLPRLGPSQPVHFRVRTPAKRESAELRINIYYRNNLLQAFLLTAHISDTHTWSFEPVVRVRLDVATTAAFGNLHRVQPRVLAVGINADVARTTHTVMLKAAQSASHSLDLGELASDSQLKKFRDLLKKHTEDEHANQYFPSWPRADGTRSSQFEVAIRELAKFGRGQYIGVFGKLVGTMKAELDTMRGLSDQTIQIVRHSDSAVFPWAVMYDYFSPSPKFADSAPICFGEALPNALRAADADDVPRGCPHNPGSEVYCIHGFWGFRHRLEQLVATREARDAPLNVNEGKAESTVCLASGLVLSSLASLKDRLASRLAHKFTSFGAEQFAKLVWDHERRPAVLILFSHLEHLASGDVQIALDAAVPPAQLLTANGLSELTFANNVWQGSPRSLVLLMACESGATEPATLNDFVIAFRNAGAAGVVGTEVPIYASLGARFSDELLTALSGSDANGEAVSLGAAVRSVCAKLVAEGNPLGLVFNYAGNADLVLT